MTKEEAVGKIVELIEDVAGISASDIHVDSMLMDDLELSSLEIMTFIADMERVFGIRFKESELMNIVTVDDAAQCVMEKLG